MIRGYWTHEVFVFAMRPRTRRFDARARMFAPGLSVLEDPATGSACAALGGYLGAPRPAADGTLRWVVEQGFEMGRPSILDIETDKAGGRISGVRVGGSSVVVCDGMMEI